MYYIIISSPSGGGKTTICNMLLQNPKSPIYQNVTFSISATTRQKRIHETDGKEYFFHSKEEFQQMIQNNELLEYANVCGNLYGTPLKGISTEKHTIFDIDYQGFRQIKQNGKNKKIGIFLLPPSIDALQKRLENRGDISSENIKIRMENAIEEIMHSHEYDFILTNASIEKTFEMVCSIIKYIILHNEDSYYPKICQITNDIKKTNINNISSYLNESLNITEICTSLK